MDALKIYHSDGTLLKDENGTVITTKSLTYTGSWMGECFVSVTFKNPAPINFGIGDYLTYRGEVFEINYDPGKIKSSSRNSIGEAFTYDSVKFNSKQYELVRAEFLDIVLHDNDTHYTSLTKFPFYVQSVDDLLDRIQANLDEQYGAAVWKLYSRNKMRSEQRGCLSEEWMKVYGEGIADNVIKSTSITVDGKTCWDALALVNSQFDINFIVRGRNVYVGTAGVPTSIIFEYGKGNGLYEIEQNADSEQSITTRLRAYGSTKNMPSRYYANMDGSTLPNNMAVNNLMLPGFPNQSLQEWWNAQTTETKNRIYSGSKEHIFSDNKYRPFVDSININEIGVRPNSIYFDTENLEEGIIEIYPTIEEMEVGGVRIDEVESADIIEDNGVFKDGETVPNFHIYLKSAIDFDINDLIKKSTETPLISMKDGMCGAREFQINSAKKLSDGRWELTCQRQADDSLNLYFPYNDYLIKGGDHFVLIGIPLPDSYVTAASIKLLKYALEFLDKNDYTRYVYSPKIDEIFMARQHDAAMADTTGTIQSIHDTIKEGDFMQFTDNDLGIEGSVTIDQLTIKEEDGKIPTYEVTLREDKSVGTIQKIQNKISSLESGNGGLLSAGMSYAQIETLLKNYDRKAQNKYLSKTHDDTADGQLTFGKGFISKEWGIFNEGWKTGSYDGNTVYDHGAMVDKDGHGVFQSLFARGFISAPKFVFNEINVTMAEQWNTNAYGTIESVDTKTRQITLHLEKNDYGSVSVGDICRGIFADLGDTYQSDSNVEGALDDCNFVVHRGFFTTYFTVEKIITSEKGHCVFQYRKRTKTTPDPCAYMDFAQYGSFTDKTRQSSMYLSSRGHSFIEVLDGVDNWEIQPQNRVARYGWLGDLVIQHDDGTKETLKGNGLFAQNHVYFGGDIIKLSNISDLDDLQKMAGAYDVSLSRYQGVITVDDMGNVIGGIYTLSDMPQGDGSVKQVKQWRLSTAVFVRKGQDILLEEDEANEQVTEGHYRVTAFGDGCECEIANSTVYITSIKNLRDGEADTEEEINYDEMRKMERCRVSIVVELEGKTSKTIEFPIRIAHDALPFLDCDLDNEHASVSWNTKAKTYTGFPVKSVATLLYHNNPWQIDKDSHVDGLPDGLKADISFVDKKMAISITTDGKKTGDFLAKKEGDTTVTTHNLSIHIIGTYAGARYEYSKLLTIDRRADTTVYEMIPSSDSIIMDKNKTLSVNSLSCEVWATSSDDKRYKVDDLAAAGLEIKYCKGDGTPDLAFGTSVSVTKDDKSITLGLFNKATGELLDRESVPIVAWGEDGKGVEFIYFRSKDAQTVLDNFKPDEWFADPNYQGGSGAEYVGEIKKKYPGWTDDPQGVDSTYPYEYVSVRKSVNGVWGKFSYPAIYATMARSIKGVNTFYAIVAQDQAGTKPSDSEFIHDDLSDVVISDNKGKWIWSADKVEYFDSSAPDYLNKTCLGACEELANVTEQYGVSTDPSVQPSAPYDPSGAYPTNLKDGDCIWSRDHIVWLNNSSSDTDWQFIGKIGVDGDGVTKTEIAYGSSTSDQYLPKSWYDSQSKVTINDTYCWFWTRTIWHYKKSADKTAYTKSYKGKNGTPATYYEARFSEQRAAVYVEQGYETGYVGVKFSGSFYLVEGDNASLASGSGLGLKLEFLDEAGTVIVTRTASVNGSSFSYNNSSNTDIQSNYRNQDNKITSCRYTVICNDGRDTKIGVIPIGFNAGSVFYQTEDRFESLLQKSTGYSELTQTANGIYTHVQRLETNMLMGTTTGVGWTKEVTSDASDFSFNEAARQFDIVNYYPAFRSGYEEKGTSYSTLKSPIVRIEKNKKYIISFCMTTNSKVSFSIGIRFGTASECSSGARYFTWANNVEPDDNSTKQEGVIYRSKSDSSRYFVIIETNTSSYEYMQVLFINAVVVSKKDDIPISTSRHAEDVVTHNSAWPYSDTTKQTLNSSTIISDGDTVKTTKERNAYFTGSSRQYSEETDVTIYSVDSISMSVSKIQMEQAVRDQIADIEPSEYKESQNAIESYIKQTADSIVLHASQIHLEGYTTINKGFSIDEKGNMTANNMTANNANIIGGRLLISKNSYSIAIETLEDEPGGIITARNGSQIGIRLGISKPKSDTYVGSSIYKEIASAFTSETIAKNIINGPVLMMGFYHGGGGDSYSFLSSNFFYNQHIDTRYIQAGGLSLTPFIVDDAAGSYNNQTSLADVDSLIVKDPAMFPSVLVFKNTNAKKFELGDPNERDSLGLIKNYGRFLFCWHMGGDITFTASVSGKGIRAKSGNGYKDATSFKSTAMMELVLFYSDGNHWLLTTHNTSMV